MSTTTTTTSSSNRTSISSTAATKVIYSPPASPNNGETSTGGGSNSISSNTTSNSLLSTPKKNLLDATVLKTIREKLRTPSHSRERYDILLESSEQVNVIKERYLISSRPSTISAAAAAKTPASYRHLIDLTSSNLNCTDVFTEEQFLCKIINEPLHKVQRAYFKLKQDVNECRSSILGHALIRDVHDIVSMSAQRTYVIVPAEEHNSGVYEDLHTYIRNNRRLCETEARALFHQICETVQVCHRNGIILRDLKLKRFYFIDEERTKLQYESLEGSMILDNPGDDTLSDKIGCPLYTAPELLCPNPTYQGKPADMWSLGVILYTMLVGQYPFYEKGSCNLITIIRHCHVQIPSSLSKSVRWLLLSLLRKNHEERMRAEHIFLSPWLREQLPAYMYIKVDDIISDEEEDDENEEDQEMPQNEDDNDCNEPLDYSCTALQMEDVEMG